MEGFVYLHTFAENITKIMENFDYILPQEKIAQFPLQNRDECKLLVYKNQKITDSTFTMINEFLPPQCRLILNNSKVIQARIKIKTNTQKIIEVFCLNPYPASINFEHALLSKSDIQWNCLVGNKRNWNINQTLTNTLPISPEKSITLITTLLQKSAQENIVLFEWDEPNFLFKDILELFGSVPLPPYIKRSAIADDKEYYQAVYALQPGSVAAPTAGLHFTNELMNQLKQNQHIFSYLTLHVGLGTFKAITSTDYHEHIMHAEMIEINKFFLQHLIEHPHTNIAVGTTSLRTLETIYWLGVKIYKHPHLLTLALEQKDVSLLTPYKLKPIEAIQYLLNWLNKQNLDTFTTSTQLYILPNSELNMAQGIITNFHQPNSSLISIVSCITKKNWRSIYQHALTHDYRFLSYGDVCYFEK